MPSHQHHGAKALTKKQQAAFPAIYKPREPLKNYTKKVWKGWRIVISDSLGWEGKIEGFITPGIRGMEAINFFDTPEQAQAWVKSIIANPKFAWAAWDETCIPCCLPDDQIVFAEAI